MAKKDVLKEIIAKKKERLALCIEALPLEQIKSAIPELAPTRDFLKAINKPRQISLIAEIKKASPSQGVIRQDFNHLEIAKAYQETEVQAISVLTEEDYFQGDINYLKEVKELTQVPILRKDFIIDEYQIYESRYYGADALLLIADLLTQEQIASFTQIAQELGISALVEVHDERELKKVLKLKAVNLIGINNRNLHTLEVDSKTTERLYLLIPKDKTVVVESGIKSKQDVMFLKILGIQACLIGTAFMKEPDLKAAVENMMGW
ncbi:MAG: indole-3-glycerol phosphate synthase TrpC [Candidatus Omnitrophica bacterium]|nr:indole-3-glycerol phosphate synthase TrpC [Candidatus Omnitrophota bacterium]